MKKFREVRDNLHYLQAKAYLAAVDATGAAMQTKVGKAALIVPIAVRACTIAAGAVDAQGMINEIMGVLKPGVVALGSLVAVVGGIQTGVGFKDDNADGKTRGFQTLIGGAIIAAVGGVVPSELDISGGGGA
ncbi:MAG: hypothetical protein ACI4I1_10365 [Oscillospiraceae bacterium]